MTHPPPFESDPGDPQDSERSRTQSSRRTWSKPQVRRVMLADTSGADYVPVGESENGDLPNAYRPPS